MIKEKIFRLMLDEVQFGGYNDQALRNVASKLGVDDHELNYTFPQGLKDFSDCALEHISAEFSTTLNMEDNVPQKISDRIIFALDIKINVLRIYKVMVREILGWYSLRLVQASLSIWKTTNLIWHWSGDRSVDFNYYSKRIVLSQIYIKLLLFFIQDDSIDQIESRFFMRREVSRLRYIPKIEGALSLSRLPVIRYILTNI